MNNILCLEIMPVFRFTHSVIITKNAAVETSALMPIPEERVKIKKPAASYSRTGGAAPPPGERKEKASAPCFRPPLLLLIV